MHNAAAEDNAYFVCDFCHEHWADNRPMVEGHQGSLICSVCLKTALAQAVLADAGMTAEARLPAKCTMCLETRGHINRYWQSPAQVDACICERCLLQSADTLESDVESGWRRPVA